MEQEIVRLYKTNSLNKISLLTGLSKHKIKKILSKHKIKLRTRSESVILNNGKDISMFSKDNISKMYNEMSIHEMALKLNIHYRNVYSWLKKYNIPVNSTQNNESIYYVYVLCDPFVSGVWEINGYIFHTIPFYIGYGKSDRCLQHMSKYSLGRYNKDKNDIIKNILSKNGFPIIYKIKTNLSMMDAMKLESIMIMSAKKYGITNKSVGGEIGGRYMKYVAKYEPDFDNFNHKLIEIYDSVNEATTKNKISKINFKGISCGFVYQKFDSRQDVNDILHRKLSDFSIKVYGVISHYKNPVCVYDSKGFFVKLSKQNIILGDIKFRMPDNLRLYRHKSGYYCVRKDNIKWDYKDNILNHTAYKNGKLTLQNL